MILATSACLSPEGETPSEQRADVLEMRDQTLADLYEEDAEARSAVRESAGYAVFSNISSKIFILSTAAGG